VIFSNLLTQGLDLLNDKRKDSIKKKNIVTSISPLMKDKVEHSALVKNFFDLDLY